MAQKLNRQQARWSLFLSQFDLQLRHVAGTKMIQSDTLSRLKHLNTEVKDNDNMTLLPNDMFVKSIDLELEGRIRTMLEKDQIITDTLKALKEGLLMPMNSSLDDWSFENGVIYFRNKCYIPPNQDLQREVVRRYHNLRPMGHPGQFGTLELVRREYWWPGMAMFVCNYVRGCAVCQQTKINTHPTRLLLMAIPAKANAYPFKTTTMDFITDLLPSNGFDSIMVMADHDATKGVILCPCNKTIGAMGTTHLVHQNLYKYFGLPSRIISDHGLQFSAKVFQKLTRLLGVKLAMSTVYHPQMDGGTER